MNLAELPPAARIADNVYGRLRDAIFEGTLVAGSRLSVPVLAQQLGVSRSPVREAVARLTQERLAQEEPRRGAVVARVRPAELVGLYEVRSVLEGLAARLATERSGPELAEALTAIVIEHQEAVARADLAAHRDADMRFHRFIRVAAANPELLDQLDGIQARVRLAMLTTSTSTGPQHAVDDHLSILDAIQAGNAAEAEVRARNHIERLARVLAGDIAGAMVQVRVADSAS